MIRDELIERIKSREARVAIVGLGYVGLPLVLRFGEERFPILGFDVDPDKVVALNRGGSYIRHIPAERIAALVNTGQFEATADFARLTEADCIVICVPTPLGEKREPDLRYVESTAQAVLKTLRKGQVVSLESTTYPGTTDDILQSAFAETGLRPGQDYFLVYSPEREDPGNAEFSTRTIPKVVGGTTADCLMVGEALYGQIIDRVVSVSSTRAAELVKLLENIYRCVNIALVNELKLLTERMDIDIWEVIEAASSKPFGFKPFYPGPGLGGHCIPIDPFYLSWKAKEYGFPTRFIELAGAVNTAIPEHVVQRIGRVLNERSKPIRGSKVLIVGVAYKKDVEDIRESPALEIMELLEDQGASLCYHDPYVARLKKVRKHDFSHMASVDLSTEILADQDAVLITTDHTNVDYQKLVAGASLVIDTRNATKGVLTGREKIVRA